MGTLNSIVATAVGGGGGGGGTSDHSALSNRSAADQHPQSAITNLVSDLAAKAPSASPSLTGSVTIGGTFALSASAMGANAVDVAKARNTKTLSADTTLTFSATPSDGAEWGLELTGHSANVTVTLPASCVRADTGEALASFVMPANRKAFVCFRRVGSSNYVSGVPGVKIMIPFAIEQVVNEDYPVLINSIWAGLITAVTTDCKSGTCTLTTKINTTALGGTANAVSTSQQTQSQSTSNAVAVGDSVVVTASSNSACLRLVGSIEMLVY